MKKKLLYVCSDFSSVHQLQHTFNLIEYFIEDFDIEVVEISDTQNNSTDIKKQFEELVVVHTLGEDKSVILDIIENYDPFIIHFQEIPQLCLSSSILNKIFSKNRSYFILSRIHNVVNPSEIIYIPDRYIFTSDLDKKTFENIKLPVDSFLWEYPTKNCAPNRDKAKEILSLDKDWKHVLNVGSFSPIGNQGEIFTIARQLEKYKIKFHFIGNQKTEYEYYWGPLLKHKPENCVIWGDRNDVNTFYEACDMFYLSSVSQLTPISMMDGLNWELPCVTKNHNIYSNTHYNSQLVKHINDNLLQTKQIILETLNPSFNEIPGWFAYKDLYDNLIETSPFEANVVEVGAWFGKSTNYLAEKIRKSKKNINFTTVDTWKGTDDEELHQNIVGKFNGDIFFEFIDNTRLSNNYGHFNIIKDTSENASKQFANNSIDFIMIDAGHSYEALMSDFKYWYHKVKPGGYISGDDYGVFHGVTQASDEFFYNQIGKGFRSFIRKKPRIQIKHLLTRPNDLREMVSISSIKQLQSYGIDYQPIVNRPYEGPAPSEHCRRPEHLSEDNRPGELYPGAGLGWITGRHYGCYLAHRMALETIDETNFDYTLVFEADAFIYTGLEEFVDMVHKACFISERDDVYYIGLANNPCREKHIIDSMFSKTGPSQDLAHAYLIPNRTKKWWIERIEDCEWDAGDLWFNHIFNHHPKSRYTTNKIYSKQAEGYSLLDEIVKTWI